MDIWDSNFKGKYTSNYLSAVQYEKILHTILTETYLNIFWAQPYIPTGGHLYQSIRAFFTIWTMDYK